MVLDDFGPNFTFYGEVPENTSWWDHGKSPRPENTGFSSHRKIWFSTLSMRGLPGNMMLYWGRVTVDKYPL